MKQHANLVETLEPRKLLSYPISFGSNAYDTAFEITKIPGDGVLVAGLFKGAIDVDPSGGQSLLAAREEETDIYVARYAESGALVWAHRFGGIEGDFEDNERIDTATDPERAGPFDLGLGLNPKDLGEYVTGVASDAGGNFYVTGTFRGVVDFDPGAGVAALSSIDGEDFVDTFLLKLNSAGNFVFVKQIGGRFTDVAQDLVVNGNAIHMTGYYTREADFDPGPATVNLSTQEESRENVFIARYDLNGALVWAKDIANEDTDRTRRNIGNAIAVDAQGNSYIAGSFSGEVDFDPSAAQHIIEGIDQTDSFVLKLNSSGNFVWAKTFGGDEFDGAQEIAVSPQGRVYVASYFEEVIDADPSPTVVRPVFASPEEIGDDPEFIDILISSFRATDGSLVWAKPFGGQGVETIGGLGVDPSDGGVYLSGGFYGAADFDPGRGRTVLTSTIGADDFEDPNDGDRDFSYDAFLYKLDSAGRFVFANRFGAQSDDYGTALAIDSGNGNVAMAGTFRGSIRIPNSSAKLRPIGREDSFVSLYDALGDLLS